MLKRIALAIIVLPLAAAPAPANWFSNPEININLNIGSAPSPTPDDVLVERLPMLVRDTDGNVIAMIDTQSGKIVATAEPPPPGKGKAIASPTVQTKVGR